jgi:Tol biopolymer transport system component
MTGYTWRASFGVLIFFLCGLFVKGDAQLKRGSETTWSPDGRQILFSSSLSLPNREIYNNPGLNIQQLTRNTYAGVYPMLTPDGKNTLFTTNEEGPRQAYVMNMPGNLVCPSLSTNVCLCQRGSDKPELFAAGVVSTEFMETSSTFSPDGKTVYFTRSDIQFADNTILQSHFRNGVWTTPEVASFSGVWRDSEPDVSPDGMKLFFVSNRPVSGDKPLIDPFEGRITPGANIWYVEKRGDGWGEPVHLAGAINQVPRVFNPSITKSGILYFSAYLSDGAGKNQIYRSVPVNGVYGAPERLSFSDPQWNHMDPSVDPDERFMVFASNRPGAIDGSNDIFIVFQKDGVWGEPIAFGESVNSRWLENAPNLAPDGKTLYFTSTRTNPGLFPKKKESYADVSHRLQSAENGSRNIWRVNIVNWLENNSPR